jgi:hypothetical protein
VLGVADNQLKTVPTCLAQMTALESLDLERNRLSCSLAQSPIAHLTQLSLLALAGNEDIVDVPTSVLKKAKGDAKHLFRHLAAASDHGGDVGETRRARMVVCSVFLVAMVNAAPMLLVAGVGKCWRR